jgi:hypothetical protein
VTFGARADLNKESLVRIEAHGHPGIQIRSFRDWETYALPEERRHH